MWTTSQAVIEGYYDCQLNRESLAEVLRQMGHEELAESYQEGWDSASEKIPMNSPFHN